jgi:hypothetical protein
LEVGGTSFQYIIAVIADIAGKGNAEIAGIVQTAESGNRSCAVAISHLNGSATEVNELQRKFRCRSFRFSTIPAIPAFPFNGFSNLEHKRVLTAALIKEVLDAFRTKQFGD